MRKLILAAAMAIIGFLPISAQAQAPAPAPQKPGDMFGLNSSQVVAIGVGIVGGVVIAEAVIGLPVVAGAVAGGLVGNWWYSQQVEEMKSTAVRRANAVADEAKLYLIGASEYASATVGTLGAWLPGRAE
jgi:hypothetical protein